MNLVSFCQVLSGLVLNEYKDESATYCPEMFTVWQACEWGQRCRGGDRCKTNSYPHWGQGWTMSSGSPRREGHFGSGQSGRRPQRRLPAWPLHWGRRALFRTPAHWILTTAFALGIIIIIRWYYYLHLIDEKTEAWRMKIFSSSCASPITSPSVHSSLHPLPLPALNHAGWVGRTLSGGHCLWALPMVTA